MHLFTLGGANTARKDEKTIQGALNKHHYGALTTMGHSGTLTDGFARKLVPGFFLGQLRPRQIFDRRRILRALEDREAVGDLNIYISSQREQPKWGPSTLGAAYGA